jgi:predicted nucleic acid-binding protein
MGQFVVDASVAIKWFVLEADSDKALELIAPNHTLIAPDLLLLEVIALLSRRVREGVVSLVAAKADMADLPRFFASITPSNDVTEAAFELSLTIRHPLYDCIYLALAEKLGVQMITADGKLATRLAGTAFEARIVQLSNWLAA